ncbi:MAG: ABC-2 family transporter protein [Sandaracinaceae bacterium]|nr:ABC-2 family transporter protein [Sandaracinaceae bacterium]
MSPRTIRERTLAARFRGLTALPTMMRIGFHEAMAYRAELFVWMLTTTMPLVMLPLWLAVAETGPVGGYDGDHFVAYFLVAFVVRQLTAVWASYTLNYEVVHGTLAMRLMRPVHPFWSYAVESLSAIPLRLVIALPVSLIVLVVTAGRHLPSDPAVMLLGLLAIAGAWCIAFFANVAIGALSLFTQSSLKLVDAWLAGYFVMSGYLVPLSLFPPAIRDLPNWLPFRYQLGFPVELWTGALDRDAVFVQLGAQWCWVATLACLAAIVWNRGLARFSAVSG